MSAFTLLRHVEACRRAGPFEGAPSSYTPLVSTHSDSRRFREPNLMAQHLLELVLVRCPGCGGPAQVVPVPGAERREREWPPWCRSRRLVCRGCGHARDRDGGPYKYPTFSGRDVTGSATDPYFRLPLLLQVRTRHGWLWALNREHLDLIADYVRTGLRERNDRPWPWTKNRTVISRLPRWIKEAKNRDEVLRAVQRARTLLTAP